MSLKYVRPVSVRNCSIGLHIRTRPRRSASERRFLAVTLVGRFQQHCLNFAEVAGQHEIAIRVRVVRVRHIELDNRQRLAHDNLPVALPQPFSAEPFGGQVGDEVQTGGQKPVRKRVLGELYLVADTPPHTRATTRIRVHRHDAQRRITAEQLMRFGRQHPTRQGFIHPGGAPPRAQV